jgi:hypothetical protein
MLVPQSADSRTAPEGYDLPLKVGRDFPCPEVAEFHGTKTNFPKIWQAGDEPFPFDDFWGTG